MTEVLANQPELDERAVAYMVDYIWSCQPQVLEGEKRLPSQRINPQDPDNIAPNSWDHALHMERRHLDQDDEEAFKVKKNCLIIRATELAWQKAEQRRFILPLKLPQRFLGLDEELKSEIAPYYSGL